ARSGLRRSGRRETRARQRARGGRAGVRPGVALMDPQLMASQKRHDMMSAFWPRKISPYLTKILVYTPITPNQTTVLWGALSVLNSVLVYLAMTGTWALIPVIPLVYVFTFVLDCVDGEI